MRHQKRKGPVEETTFGDEVVNSLNDFFAHVERGEPITVRTIKLNLQPSEYTAEDVRCIRTKLGVSQAIFAQMLAVSVKAVQSWEQGDQTPTGPARRLLDDMNHDPKRWLQMLKQSFTSQESPRRNRRGKSAGRPAAAAE